MNSALWLIVGVNCSGPIPLMGVATRSSPTSSIATSITRTSATSIASSARSTATEKDADHYVLSLEQIDQKLDELTAIGGMQILLQGGHHPGLNIDYYLNLLAHIREKYPHINVHGFSPPEFNHFARGLRDAAEGSDCENSRRPVWAAFPAVAGRFSSTVCATESRRSNATPTNGSTSCAIAHALGLNSSATMMFGHVETLEDRIEHLERLRATQDETGGFTAFICWTFQAGTPGSGPGHTRLRAEPVGSSEYLRMQALSRIFLDNFPNVQSSWVTQGPRIGQIALKYGANDFGSVMMEENVVSSAGTTFRLNRDMIEELIRDAGYEPQRRNNWYRLVD